MKIVKFCKNLLWEFVGLALLCVGAMLVLFWKLFGGGRSKK